MMKFTAVLMPSVAEQRAAGATEVYDPSGIRFQRDRQPVFGGGDYRTESICGWADNLRIEDGRLIADIETDLPHAFSLGWGMVRRDAGMELMAIHGKEFVDDK
jgi:hypothetical protein